MTAQRLGLETIGGILADATPPRRFSAEYLGARRLDIQGLRAFAVIVVVAFHAGLPVPGGFVGVDVFFVISGFVITAMLHREWASTRRINFRRFYWRRFKRLTPALALTITITMLITSFVLSPLGAQQDAAETGIGAMLLLANFVIARNTGGYFDAPAEINPLLNTWSLSVEEQFYLLFPALIAFGWLLAKKGGRRRVVPFMLIGGIGLVSLSAVVVPAIQVLLFKISDLLFGNFEFLSGFYGPVTRVWEFAAGSLLALALTRWTPRGRVLMTSIGLVGLGALGASLWLINDQTIFPGPWTLLPVAGTLLLLIAGTRSDTATSRLLSVRPMVKVGDWSYSIYLWHWPFIVFAVYIWPYVPVVGVVAAIMSLLPAWTSYRWVEQPIRLRSVTGKRQVISLVAKTMLPPLLLSGIVWLLATNYLGPRLVEKAADVNAADFTWGGYFEYLSDNYYPCANSTIRDPAPKFEGSPVCFQSQPSGDVSVVLVGDSHAQHLLNGLAETFPETNIAAYIWNSPIEDGSGMSRIIDEVVNDSTVKSVIVNSWWPSHEWTVAELSATLQTFRDAGKQVFVTDDIPAFPFAPSQCVYDEYWWISLPGCTQSYTDFKESYAQYFPKLQAAVGAVTGVELVRTTRYFCDGEECDMRQAGQFMYLDSNHLNLKGSRYVASRMARDYPSFKAAMETR